MELKRMVKPVWNFIHQYRYVILVVLLGLVLMSIPSGHKETTEESVKSETTPALDNADLSQQLSALLTQIDGAGKVEVLLTTASGAEIQYQTDMDTDEAGARVDTVIITDSAKNQSGLIRQVNPPTYLGAVVVCQGADNPTVRLAIVEAVSKVTGLGTDRISVLKMK